MRLARLLTEAGLGKESLCFSPDAKLVGLDSFRGWSNLRLRGQWFLSLAAKHFLGSKVLSVRGEHDGSLLRPNISTSFA